MKTENEMDSREEQSENNIIFASLEEIKNIERVLFNLETTRRELNKVAEGMIPIMN